MKKDKNRFFNFWGNGAREFWEGANLFWMGEDKQMVIYERQHETPVIFVTCNPRSGPENEGLQVESMTKETTVSRVVEVWDSNNAHMIPIYYGQKKQFTC